MHTIALVFPFLLSVGAASFASAGADGAVPSDLAMDSFNNAFYHVDTLTDSGYFYVSSDRRGVPDRGQFWRVAEQIAVVEDAFERSRNPVYGHMIGQLINGLNHVVSGTEDFSSWNHYNDDIMWAVIALVRSFQLTGNRAHLSQAEGQFNAVWRRGWDEKHGGMYWNTSRITKNACVNGPAAIAGFLLAESTTGTGFGAQAEAAFVWLNSTLVVPATGQVYDHISPNGQKTDWAFSYNQGTFMGAALFYARHKATSGAADSAITAAQLAGQWTQKHLTGKPPAAPGILNDECPAGKSSDGDGAGFKGIFVRWASRYIREAKDTAMGAWLQRNADSAWDQRNSHGVTWAQWSQRTPDSTVTSWECSSAASASQNQ
jgi:predicted alpha-1,6-mannanase (GH76 family)